MIELPTFPPLTPEGARDADDTIGFLQELRQSKGRWYGEPLELLPYQHVNLRELFGRRDPATGFRRYRTAFFFTPKKAGKALAVDTLIPTPNGWERMGDLRIGDVVFDEHGEPSVVVAATAHQRNRPCYRVAFSDGTSLVADAEHEWLTCTYRPENVVAVRTTEEIRGTLFWDTPSAVRSGVVAKNHRVSVCGALRLPDADLPVPPYVLGFWLGDGSTADARITVAYGDVPEVIGAIHGAGCPATERTSSNDGSGLFILSDGNRAQAARDASVQARLRGLGVLGNKHIPAIYLRSSREQRMELLHGLMDSDGYVSKRGECNFDTTCEALRDGFVELARSLGFKPLISHRRAVLYGRDCGPSFRVKFYAFEDQPIAKLTRKARRQKRRPRNHPRSTTRQIVSVDPVESVPVRCIQVSSESGLFLAGEGMVPTHNSTMAAGLVCKLTFADQELGAEVYGAAYDKDQADVVYDIAVAMVEQHEGLAGLAKIRRHKSDIKVPSTRSSYAALAHDSKGSHGKNISGLVIDEFHTWSDAELYQALQKGTASRDQPLTIVITTAGVYDPESPCWKMYDYACKVRDGIIDDPTFLPVIFETPKDEHGEELLEWDDPKAWAIAQPGLGTTVPLAFYEEQARTAANMPSEVLSFRQLLLNQWPEQLKGWLSMQKWKECGELDYAEEDFYGMKAWLGLDLGSTKDLTAATLVIPLDDDTVAVVCRVFCPADTIKRRSSEDGVQYDRWANEGWLTKTPGEETDWSFVRAEVHRLAEKFDIQEINPDPWNALQLCQELHTDGFRVVKIPQTATHISYPAKELEKLVGRGQLRHGNNPILTWCASNATVRMDANGNIKPDKSRSKEKIDPITALVNGLTRSLEGQVKRPPWLISAG